MNRRWYLWFIMFGLFGVIFEYLVGAMFSIYAYELFIYYNGIWTSAESFFLFGFFGCLGLRGVLTQYDLVKK